MLGESRSDRQITLALLKRIQEHLQKRGIEKYKSGNREIVVKELYWRATFGGRYGESNEDEERLLNDTYNALGKMGWFESLDGEELTLPNLRKNGKAWLSSRPAWHATVVQPSDIVPGQIFWPFPRWLRTKGAIRDYYTANGVVPRPSMVHRGRRASGPLQAAAQHRRPATLAAHQRTP